MPFPNEHACRLLSPSDFQPNSYRSITKGGVRIILARLKSTGKMVAQTMRYPKASWDEARARAHCEKHGGSFEPAKKD